MSHIIDQLPSMPYAQKIELLNALREAIAQELSLDATEQPQVCPRCGCPDSVKKGFGRNGEQRHLCSGCACTYSAKTHSLLANSKLPSATWMTFAECMADFVTLRVTACRCGVSLYTAWFMRMRVCEVLRRRTPPARMGNFQVDDTHFVMSLSGNHSRSYWFEMTRQAHRNGQDGRKAGGCRSKNCVAVSCGVNEYGDCFCELASQGAAPACVKNFVIDDFIPEGSHVLCDGDLSLKSALRNYSYEVAHCREINMINALHSRLKHFMSRFRGVSVRRMQRYLDWFCWRERLRGGDADNRAVLFNCQVKGLYMWTRTLTHLELHPFENYYDRRRFAEMTRHMSTVV